MLNPKNLNESSIEEIICKGMDKLTPSVPNPLVDMFLFFGLDDTVTSFFEGSLDDDFLSQILIKRGSIFGFRFETFDAVILLRYCIDSPGEAMLYLWYLQYLCKKHDIWEISGKILATKFFPNGFFSHEDMETIWKAQKIDALPDNLVDHIDYGKSLFK